MSEWSREWEGVGSHPPPRKRKQHSWESLRGHLCRWEQPAVIIHRQGHNTLRCMVHACIADS
eukprot:scaffold4898_cov229-Chaetoceros_neogracile.AAC.5